MFSPEVFEKWSASQKKFDQTELNRNSYMYCATSQLKSMVLESAL